MSADSIVVSLIQSSIPDAFIWYLTSFLFLCQSYYRFLNLIFFSKNQFLKVVFLLSISLIPGISPILPLTLFLRHWGGSLDYWLEIFFSSLLVYTFNDKNFPISALVSPVPQILYGVFSLSFSSMYSLLRLLLWPMDYLGVSCLVSKCSEIFLMYFSYWFLTWFHYGHITRTLYDLKSFISVEVCSMASITIYMFHSHLEKFPLYLSLWLYSHLSYFSVFFFLPSWVPFLFLCCD